MQGGLCRGGTLRDEHGLVIRCRGHSGAESGARGSADRARSASCCLHSSSPSRACGTRRATCASPFSSSSDFACIEFGCVCWRRRQRGCSSEWPRREDWSGAPMRAAGARPGAIVSPGIGSISAEVWRSARHHLEFCTSVGWMVFVAGGVGIQASHVAHAPGPERRLAPAGDSRRRC